MCLHVPPIPWKEQKNEKKKRAKAGNLNVLQDQISKIWNLHQKGSLHVSQSKIWHRNSFNESPNGAF